MVAFYAAYDARHRGQQPTVNELRHRYNTDDPLDDIRLQELSALKPLAGARVLDVGFGRAKFLYHMMRLGAIAHGVDLDKSALEYATGLGLRNVRRGTILDMDPGPRFDIITMNELIEHPLEPMEVLRKATALLKPEGLLSLWTPNGDGGRREQDPVLFRKDLEHMQYLHAREFLCDRA